LTLEKAIEILEASFRDPWITPGGDLADAMKLSIQGLKAVKDARANNYWTPIPTLRGETKE